MARVGWCITTDESARMHEATRMLSDAGFSWVKPFSASRDVADGKRGCFTAHVNAVRAALEADCSFAWIFEDDVAFSRALTDAERDEIEAVASSSNALVAIGGMAVGPLSPITQLVYRGRWNYTHAYVVPRARMRDVCELAYKGEHYDRVLARSIPQALVHPGLAYQRPATRSTTSDSPVYHALTEVRNRIGAWIIQALLGWFWVAVGWLLRHVSLAKSHVTA